MGKTQKPGEGVCLYLFGGVVDHDIDAQDGVVAAAKVFQVGGGKRDPLRVLAQLSLRYVAQESGRTTKLA